MLLVLLTLIALSCSLAGFGAVVMKMLPFDNKSEFQVVVDMPAGTPVEVTAAALRDLGAHVATIPEVSDYQAYAGLASPINFNGLVRQYYLRSLSEQGDLQVNLVDKSKRHRKSHEIAAAARPALEEIGRRWGAKVKVIEVPPGPPVLSPIVAEVYGPDEPGRIRVAKKVREALAATPDIVGIDDTVDDPAPRIVLRVDQGRAAIATTRERRRSGAFPLQVATLARTVDDLADQQGAAVTELRHERTELVPGVGHGERPRARGDGVADAAGRERRGIDA